MKDTPYFRTATYENNGENWIDYDKITVPAAKSILECFMGPMIGSGVSRRVFSCKADPSLVIKIGGGFDTQNAVEAAVWDRFSENNRVNKWLAPIVARSADLRVIVQKRTKPVIKPPTKIPDFLGDLKVQNFGMLDGRLVAHDYGLGIFIDNNSPIEMVAPKWWDAGTGNYYD